MNDPRRVARCTPSQSAAIERRKGAAGARGFLRLAYLHCTATRLHHPRSSILRALRVMRLWAVRWTRSNDEALIFLAIIYDRNLSLNFLFYDRNQCVISNILVWEPLILSSEQMEDNLGNQSLT